MQKFAENKLFTLNAFLVAGLIIMGSSLQNNKIANGNIGQAVNIGNASATSSDIKSNAPVSAGSQSTVITNKNSNNIPTSSTLSNPKPLLPPPQIRRSSDDEGSGYEN